MYLYLNDLEFHGLCLLQIIINFFLKFVPLGIINILLKKFLGKIFKFFSCDLDVFYAALDTQQNCMSITYSFISLYLLNFKLWIFL